MKNRLGGPAVIPNGTQLWYKHGEKVTKKEVAG